MLLGGILVCGDVNWILVLGRIGGPGGWTFRQDRGLGISLC